MKFAKNLIEAVTDSLESGSENLYELQQELIKNLLDSLPEMNYCMACGEELCFEKEDAEIEVFTCPSCEVEICDFIIWKNHLQKEEDE